jgi:hypothetical protein
MLAGEKNLLDSPVRLTYFLSRFPSNDNSRGEAGSGSPIFESPGLNIRRFPDAACAHVVIPFPNRRRAGARQATAREIFKRV